MNQSRLVPLEEALDHILEQAPLITRHETVFLDAALGRTLAKDQRVPADVPPADNSAVDGYALHSRDLNTDARLPVSGRIPAGAQAAPLRPGTAMRVFTGAPVPEGADAVVMQEDVQVEDQGIRINTRVTPGQNIRRRGQDLAAAPWPWPGYAAATTGTRPAGVHGHSPGAGAGTATCGCADYRQRTDRAGQPLAPGRIYNTNRYTLLGLLTQAGCEISCCETVADDADLTRAALTRAAAAADLILTSGGVSVGEEDHIRAILQETGALSLWRLAIKPGKPLAFGHIEGIPLLGLPGNPVAVLVTFLIVVMPFLRRCQAQADRVTGERLPAAFTIGKASIRREFVRARKRTENGELCLEAYPNQSSGVLSSACWADGLAVVPEHTRVRPGDLLTYYSFTELLS